MKLVLFFGLFSLLTACTNLPANTVGAEYDADSYYCRALHNNEYEVAGSFRGPAPSNEELYERHCEPVATWQARDSQGYENKMRVERSLLNSFLDIVFD